MENKIENEKKKLHKRVNTPHSKWIDDNSERSKKIGSTHTRASARAWTRVETQKLQWNARQTGDDDQSNRPIIADLHRFYVCRANENELKHTDTVTVIFTKSTQVIWHSVTSTNRSLLFIEHKLRRLYFVMKKRTRDISVQMLFYNSLALGAIVVATIFDRVQAKMHEIQIDFDSDLFVPSYSSIV